MQQNHGLDFLHRKEGLSISIRFSNKFTEFFSENLFVAYAVFVFKYFSISSIFKLRVLYPFHQLSSSEFFINWKLWNPFPISAWYNIISLSIYWLPMNIIYSFVIYKKNTSFIFMKSSYQQKVFCKFFIITTWERVCSMISKWTSGVSMNLTNMGFKELTIESMASLL